MNTTTKLNAKTLIQLLAIAMITLTLFSCGGGTTPPATTSAATQFVTPTIVSTTATIVSTLSALATGTPSQVVISWSAAQGDYDYYRLYQSKTTLSESQNASPTNLSASPIVTFTTHTIKASTITLSDTQTVYFLVTTIKNIDDDKIESFTNATQTAATAFAMPFLTVVSTSTNAASTTNRVWMDRNLGATRTATDSGDIFAYGDLYQWGRPADGHQKRTSTTSAIIAGSIAPTHGEFIYSVGVVNGDWTSVDDDGALRSAYWARTDGSSICPTGFRVPTNDELIAELDSWSGNAGAYNSNLKWPIAVYREPIVAAFALDAAISIWSTTADVNSVSGLKFALHIPVGSSNFARAYGSSVRCIKPLLF